MRSNIGTDVAVAEFNSQIAATTGQAARFLGVIVEVGAWAEFCSNYLYRALQLLKGDMPFAVDGQRQTGQSQGTN